MFGFDVSTVTQYAQQFAAWALHHWTECLSGVVLTVTVWVVGHKRLAAMVGRYQKQILAALEYLREQGASFFDDIARDLSAEDPERKLVELLAILLRPGSLNAVDLWQRLGLLFAGMFPGGKTRLALHRANESFEKGLHAVFKQWKGMKKKVTVEQARYAQKIVEILSGKSLTPDLPEEATPFQIIDLAFKRYEKIPVHKRASAKRLVGVVNYIAQQAPILSDRVEEVRAERNEADQRTLTYFRQPGMLQAFDQWVTHQTALVKLSTVAEPLLAGVARSVQRPSDRSSAGSGNGQKVLAGATGGASDPDRV